MPLHDFAAKPALVRDRRACHRPDRLDADLALVDHAARWWEPKRLWLRLLSIAGWLALSGRRRWLHLAATAPFTDLLLDALRRLDVRAAPG